MKSKLIGGGGGGGRGQLSLILRLVEVLETRI